MKFRFLAISAFAMLTVNSSFSQTKVTSVVTHTETATASGYSSGGDDYTYGNGLDVYIDSLSIGAKDYALGFDIYNRTIQIKRVDNSISSGERCRIFIESTTHFDFEATYPVDGNGDCSMETALYQPIVNRGALDVFQNRLIGVEGANNIERVDMLTVAMKVPANKTDIGFLATEKNANNDYQAAAILSLDANGEPASYGDLIHILGTNIAGKGYGELAPAYSGRFLENALDAPHGLPEGYYSTAEEIGYTLLTFDDLGLSEGQIIHGISFFGPDVDAVADTLTDPSTFPRNTAAGADIHGAFGNVFHTSSIVLQDLIDFDGDGIANSYDEDNDNDGIPDVIERSIPGQEINWNDYPVNTNPSGNYNIGNSVATLSLDDPLGVSTKFDVNTFYAPDYKKMVHLVQDEIEASDSSIIKIDFDSPIYNFGLKLLDIDKVGSIFWQDLVEINYYTGGTIYNLTLADYTIDATTTEFVSGNQFRGIATAPNHSGKGFINVLIEDLPIDSVRIILRNGFSALRSHGIALAAMYTTSHAGGYYWDNDKDGIYDYMDLDSDNDGIPDLVEAGGIDMDGDGEIDYPISGDPNSMVDIDADGWSDHLDTDDSQGSTAGWVDGIAIPNLDTDGDGLYDYLDLDADNDGIPDLVESGVIDADGRVDTTGAWDVDGDGLTDIYDENVSGGSGQALIITDADTNSDGILNNGEKMVSGGFSDVNNDDDLFANHLDLDADNDGITDVVENAAGIVLKDNSSGIPLNGRVINFNDAVNKDGWNDTSSSNTLDSDGDGVADYIDKDSDNDGIPDRIEGVCSTCPIVTDASEVDANSNGVWDKFENLNAGNLAGTNLGVVPNLDNDSNDTFFDYLDTDADSDGTYDWTEGFDHNGNEQAADDILAMADVYELGNSNVGHYPSSGVDTDSDGLPDWLDNQPTVTGYNEAIRPPFLNHSSSFWVDLNTNGLADIFDVERNGSEAPIPNTDKLDDKDWRDANTQTKLPVELNLFIARKVDCNTQLVWATETEADFDRFEVEYSKTGQFFKPLYSVNGQGGSSMKSYSYKHNTAGKENYYRLKMIDLDGTVEYSEILTVLHDCAKEYEATLFPNPVGKESDFISIKYFAESEHTIIRLIDATGRMLRSMQANSDLEWNITRLDISKLPSGVYYVKIDESNGAQRFIITD